MTNLIQMVMLFCHPHGIRDGKMAENVMEGVQSQSSLQRELDVVEMLLQSLPLEIAQCVLVVVLLL